MRIFVYNIEEYVFSDFYIKLINTILYYFKPALTLIFQ